jgi:hypothetical protein
MVTYIIMALAVALLAGFTGAMPGPAMRVPSSGSADEPEADPGVIEKPADRQQTQRTLPSEIMDALAEAKRLTGNRREPGTADGGSDFAGPTAIGRAGDDPHPAPVKDASTT